VLATTDFGGLSLMREWNAFCVAEGTAFLPAVLNDYVGYVGPLVVPGETACFECFWLRQNSNLEQPELIRKAELAAFQGQLVDGVVPMLAAQVGRLAAFELYKFHMRHTLGWRAGTVVEADLLESTVARRKLLRAPRCPVCSSGARHGRISVESDPELPGNPFKG
jgi:thiazole/oxazole-forming peptide maturase SagC family component